MNSEFTELITNDDFVRMVKDAQDTDKLLNDLVMQCPQNSNDLKYAVEFIRIAREDKQKMQTADSERILKNIQNNPVGKDGRTILFRRLANSKVAAIALLVLAIGALVMFSKQDSLKQFAHKNEVSQNDAMIVLSDGSKHILNENELDINYNSKEGEVVVQKEESVVATIKNEPKNKREFNEVIVPYGQRQHVVLNDGTSVELNAGSKLVFPAVFSGNNRTVYLIGEGYFDVTKDSNRPFIVKTDFIDVKVYGTEFNVTAYKDEELASAVLVEGSVSVKQSDKILKKQALFIKPGEACFYSTVNEELEIKDIDVDLYISWKDGIYNFKDVPLSYVITRVKKYYNVEITVENADLLETKLSGKLLITGDIEEVIQYISRAVECRYEKPKEGNYFLSKY